MTPTASPLTRNDPMVRGVLAKAFNGGNGSAKWDEPPNGAKPDILVATPADIYDPVHVFPKLRWGGQFIFCSPYQKQVEAIAQQFSSHGFLVETEPAYIRVSRVGWLRWFLGKPVYYFVARKVHLIPPGEMTERFTYDVKLVQRDGQYVVQKSVPTIEAVMGRLRRRFPDVADGVIESKARKFTEKIFPLFLTRETAMLQILQRDLPKPYDQRIPHVIDVDKDERGFVRRFTMNWLRNGTKPLSHIEFARQSADLLHILHDHVGVIHLDLRLDNFVITDQGVGFVDFGSSVRVGEDLSRNPLLGQLFDELMRTSQIQIMLERMTTSGLVTSHAFKGGYKKVDKSVDFFYLAVQFNSPHVNPDLKPLILLHPGSAEATALSKLTQQILKPSDPANPVFTSALDILRGVIRIKDGLANSPAHIS
ncbi:MAG TPA: hypothetical protein VGG19_13725 [Tepidisphaeraceae bacterium]|jgi:hypothetical protein